MPPKKRKNKAQNRFRSSSNRQEQQQQQADGPTPVNPQYSGEGSAAPSPQPDATHRHRIEIHPPYGKIRKRIWEFRRLFLLMGFSLGVVLTLLISPPPQLKSLDFDLPKPVLRMAESLGDVELMKYLPEGVQDVIGKWSIPSFKSEEEYEDFIPGARLAAQGLVAKHPVILIPGIVSTGLEVWNTVPTNSSTTSTPTDAPTPPNSTNNPSDTHIASELAAQIRLCGQKYFRKRMWGTLDQFRALLFNKQCWLNHMLLDPTTGLDPPGVKLRAAQGLDAADYLFPGFWVWGKIIANLGAVGYDSNNMHLAAYDWRLAYKNLEKRDMYFTKLKTTIELAYQHTGEKAVIMSHSMGSTIFFYFLSWIRFHAGEEWCSKYLHAWVNIAGTLLGTPKTISALISGEMRDTAQLSTFGTRLLDAFFERGERARLFRSLGGLVGMLPYGGSRLWGAVGTFAPDEANDAEPSYGSMVEIDDASTNSTVSLSADEIKDFITSLADKKPYWVDDHLYGVAETDEELDGSIRDPRTWSNPLMTPLPKIEGGFKVYCMYGTGLPTERKYFYKTAPSPSSSSPYNDLQIKTTHTSLPSNISSGVQNTNGDGTVPLLSLGYMCTTGWQLRRYNPSNINIITKEFPDASTEKRRVGMDLPEMIRGGPGSGDHVDLLGNYEMTEDLVRIVTGGVVEERVLSEIKEVGGRVRLPEFN